MASDVKINLAPSQDLLGMLLSRKIELGLYLIVLLFPFINLQVFLGDKINVPAVDLLALFVFAAWILKTVWHWGRTGKFLKIKDFPGVGFFLLFIGASLLSLYNSDDPILSLKFVLRPLAFFYLMFVVVPYNTISSKKILQKILWAFYWVGMFISAMGLASIFLVPRPDFLRIVPVALFGIFPLGTNQNLIAETLVVIIPFTALLVYWTKDVLKKKLLILSLILMAVVTLGTLSRAGLIVILIELLIFVLYHFRKNLRVIVPLAVLALIVALPLAFYFSQLFSSDISRKATENRILLTRIAIDAFKDHPIIGSGAGIYVRLVEVNRTFIRLFGNPIDSHGVVQKLLAETGMVGFATFSALVAYIFWRILRPFKKLAANDPARKVMLACFTVVVAGFFFQLFNTSYYVSKLWLPVGVALAAVRLVEEKKLS